MKLQNYFIVFSKVLTIFLYYISKFAPISITKLDKEKLSIIKVSSVVVGSNHTSKKEIGVLETEFVMDDHDFTLAIRH